MSIVKKIFTTKEDEKNKNINKERIRSCQRKLASKFIFIIFFLDASFRWHDRLLYLFSFFLRYLRVLRGAFKYFFVFQFCLMISLLTGCFGPAPAPQMTTYQLQEVSHQKLAHSPTCTTLLVMMPTTTATYQSKNMLYSLNEYQTQPFAKNQWAATPTQMLFPLIITSLRNTNYFHAVVPSPFSGKSDYQLTTQLTHFQQYFSEESPNSYFKMSLLAVLTNTKTRKVVAERRFDAHIAAPERSPYGGVVAANEATRKILTQLSVWAVHQLRNRPHRCYR